VEYVGNQGLRITANQFRQNMVEKMENRQFGEDVIPLLRPDITCDLPQAYPRIEEAFITQLDAAWEMVRVK